MRCKRRKLTLVALAMAVVLAAGGLQVFADEILPETGDRPVVETDIQPAENIEIEAVVEPEPQPHKEPAEHQLDETFGLPSENTAAFSIDDLTPPVLTGLTLLTPMATSPGTLRYQIQLVEEGSGLRDIELWYRNGSDYKFVRIPVEPELYSGTHEITCNIQDFALGGYLLTNVILTDRRDNRTEYKAAYGQNEDYLLDTVTSEQLDVQRTVTITESEVTDTEPPLISSFEILTKETTAPGQVTARLGVVEEGSGVAKIDFFFYATAAGGQRVGSLAYWTADEPLHTGEHLLEIPIHDRFYALAYEITSIYITDVRGNQSTYHVRQTGDELYLYCGEEQVYLNRDSSGFTVTDSQATDAVPPVLESLDITTPNVTVPGLMEVTFDLVEEETGLRQISLALNYTMTNGGTLSRSVYLSFDEPLFTGRHTVQFQITPAFHAIEYELYFVDLYDNAWNNHVYIYDAQENQLRGILGSSERAPVGNVRVSIESIYNIVVDAPNDNSLAAKLEGLVDGETALVDASNNGNVNGEVFEAIAGKDVNIIFETWNVQWIFNGRDINSPKPVSLWVNSDEVPAETLGISGETTAVRLDFAPNGELPGKATVRLNSPLLVRKQAETGELFITYYENDAFASEPAPVVIEGDNYAAFTLTHNSTYIITSTKPVYAPAGGDDGDDNNPSGPVVPQPNTGVQGGEPQTGDETTLPLYLLLAALSVAALPALAVAKKKTAA